MACSCPHCAEAPPDDGWDEFAIALVGSEGEKKMTRNDPSFDDTHDILTRGEAVERSSRDFGYNQTRDVVNEDAHVDEEYVHAAWQANVKRTYDEFQHESLESVRRNRTHIDRMVTGGLSADDVRQNIANQALQNAVETANMIGKQAVRHADVASAETWSRLETSDTAEGSVQNEQLRTMALDDASLKAIGAVVAAAVAQALVAHK